MKLTLNILTRISDYLDQASKVSLVLLGALILLAFIGKSGEVPILSSAESMLHIAAVLCAVVVALFGVSVHVENKARSQK